jgi:hypothetical protein
MHILASRTRDEFLACPQLLRIAYPRGSGRMPTLLVKATTLSLKYFIRLKRSRLVLLTVQQFLLYGLEIEGDGSGAVRWSLVETAEELRTLKKLTSRSTLRICLFNELAVNVAEGDIIIRVPSRTLTSLINATIKYPTRPDGVEEPVAEEADRRLGLLLAGALSAAEGLIVDLPQPRQWLPVSSHYITKRAESSRISIFDPDEGKQQEAIALWLVDSLDLDGAIRNPQVHENTKVRELTDLLLSYDNGAFLIESKALSMLSRPKLPGREKLATQVVAHVKKAVRQLVGGFKNVQRGLCVTDLAGKVIKVERIKAAHLIVLVPELALLTNTTEFNQSFYAEAMRASGAFLHILDLSELLRVVQAAQKIASLGKKTTPLMALDYYLMKRTDYFTEIGHPTFNVLLRVN